jgi:hypothetical protein
MTHSLRAKFDDEGVELLVILHGSKTWYLIMCQVCVSCVTEEKADADVSVSNQAVRVGFAVD